MGSPTNLQAGRATWGFLAPLQPTAPLVCVKATHRMFKTSFSACSHSLARREGTVSIQIDHILHR